MSFVFLPVFLANPVKFISGTLFLHTAHGRLLNTEPGDVLRSGVVAGVSAGWTVRHCCIDLGIGM